MSAMTTDEDQQVQYDETLQDIEFLMKAIKVAALNDWGLELK